MANTPDTHCATRTNFARYRPPESVHFVHGNARVRERYTGRRPEWRDPYRPPAAWAGAPVCSCGEERKPASDVRSGAAMTAIRTPPHTPTRARETEKGPGFSAREGVSPSTGCPLAPVARAGRPGPQGTDPPAAWVGVPVCSCGEERKAASDVRSGAAMTAIRTLPHTPTRARETEKGPGFSGREGVSPSQGFPLAPVARAGRPRPQGTDARTSAHPNAHEGEVPAGQKPKQPFRTGNGHRRLRADSGRRHFSPNDATSWMAVCLLTDVKTLRRRICAGCFPSSWPARSGAPPATVGRCRDQLRAGCKGFGGHGCVGKRTLQRPAR